MRVDLEEPFLVQGDSGEEEEEEEGRGFEGSLILRSLRDVSFDVKLLFRL